MAIDSILNLFPKLVIKDMFVLEEKPSTQHFMNDPQIVDEHLFEAYAKAKSKKASEKN